MNPAMKSSCVQSRRRIPAWNHHYHHSLVLLLLLQLFSNSVVSAYTCTFSGHHTSHGTKPSLLCRHGTKSSSGVFDARRITILYSSTEQEADGSVNTAVSTQHGDDDNNDDNAVQTTEEDGERYASSKLKRLLQRMRDVAPRLRIRLPAFMARMRSIEELESSSDAAPEGEKGLGDENIMEDIEEDVEEDDEEEESDGRSVTAASHVDLSGIWRPIVTPHFKAQYDQYLQNCSQSFMFRKVVVNGISLQKETISQLENGANLQIVASNPAGNWNRTLVASSAQDPRNVTMQDPDGDRVEVEAWWEDDGKVHKSWLRNKPRVLGGAFETARYLSKEDPNILICDSVFHPNPDAPASKGFKYGRVLWQFRREE
ncbi:unnamed protein product [Cylindrotheca closterium]|uniref:Amine oxidase n=1 Tax=Cylindrotheca closterium TaxID=2856 RepID=A0AAD2G7X1_9STRA|nr:unnamed protein product [Cylindrotheca closterium]